MQGLLPFAGIVAAASGLAWGLARLRPPEAGGPLGEFDHAAHLQRGVECGDCHVGVQADSTSARAGVPSVAVCAELCHGDFDEETVERMRATPHGRLMADHVKSLQEIWWPQAYVLPDHVVFSHRRHVGMAAIPCATCHGDIASAKTLPREPATDVLSMETCMECHEERQVTNDCFACHR